jgi:NAD(P)-dependent dehydrogenase (short-subunit alcohol dehydrogenase family)
MDAGPIHRCELTSGRNDVAIQKAKDLGTLHNVKTATYKVDGESVDTQALNTGMLILNTVSVSTDVQETIAKVVQDFGKIDVFVANAGWLQGYL